MKKNNEYDGVIYEPSSGSGQRESSSRSSAGRSPSRRNEVPQNYTRSANGVTRRPPSKPQYRTSTPQAGRSRSGRPVKKKSNFALFYVFTLFTGIMVCIVIFTIFFNNLSKEMGQGVKLAASPTPAPTPTEIVINEITQILGVIDNIDLKTGSLHLLDVTASKFHDLYYDSSTELTNKFGQIAVFSEFKIGDMVDANFNPKTGKLKSLSLSSQSWEYKQIKNVDVNAVEATVTIGNDIYIFDENLIVMYGNETYPVHSVRELDLLTVRGYKNKVSSIVVNKSHGSIEIINKDYVKNGFLEVDTNKYVDLTAAESDYIELQEGTHRIVVKGSNIEPYIKEIELGPKENIRINLEDAEYKTGVLFITANVSGYVVVVDDKQVSSDEAVTLDYGKHTVRLEKSDYEIWQKDITISKPMDELNVIMTAIIKMGKLTVNAIPAGTQLYIDNKLIGNTPLDATAEYGKHTMTLRMYGYLDHSVEIEISDEPLIYYAQLIQAPINAQTTVTAAPGN